MPSPGNIAHNGKQASNRVDTFAMSQLLIRQCDFLIERARSESMET